MDYVSILDLDIIVQFCATTFFKFLCYNNILKDFFLAFLLSLHHS